MNKKKIIFFINSLKFFLSHRINLADTAYNNNYEVVIVAKNDLNSNLSYPSYLKKYKFIDLNIRNSNLNIFSEIKNLIFIKKTIREQKPYICHFITVKSIFYAAILHRELQNRKIVISFSGIGSILANKKITSFLSKKIFLVLIKKILSFDNTRIIFQNKDDKNFIKDHSNFSNYKSYIIPGSGINLKNFSYKKILKKNCINFLFASRLLLDKGLLEFLNASQLILDNKYIATFTIIGEVDTFNPSSIDIKKINKWKNGVNKFFYGYQENVKKYIEYSDVVVLPSYREGYPKILIEASAIGRLILATNVPGCKDCVEDGVNGFLVEVNSHQSLYEGMIKLINRKNSFEMMSINSRKIAEKKYDISRVNEKHLMIYNSF